jgi:hypothetical protein
MVPQVGWRQGLGQNKFRPGQSQKLTRLKRER